MENLVGVVSVPVITTIVYIFLAVYKKAVGGKAGIWSALIPLWGLLLGAILGVIAFYTTPNLVPAENVISALLIGMVSGGAATCVNQVGKQLNKATEDKKDDAGTSGDGVSGSGDDK